MALFQVFAASAAAAVVAAIALFAVAHSYGLTTPYPTRAFGRHVGNYEGGKLLLHSNNSSEPNIQAGQGINMKPMCMLKHCPLKLARAMTDKGFIKEGMCEFGCEPLYDKDPTPMKLHYQNCTTTCALSYQSPANDALMGCAMNNDCIEFAHLGGACPKPDIDQTSSLDVLSGEWWQIYGKNALWDCYDCQHIHELSLVDVNQTDAIDGQDATQWCARTADKDGNELKPPCWKYTYSYDLYTVDPKHPLKYFQQTWQLPGPYGEKGRPTPTKEDPDAKRRTKDYTTGKAVDINYAYMGSAHNETWFILAYKKDAYVVLVDCSYMGGWTNVGSILWARPGYELTSDDEAKIADVYQTKMKWQFPQQFCKNRSGPKECDGQMNAEKLKQLGQDRARMAAIQARAAEQVSEIYY